MNQALAQQTLFRAQAEACFLVDRRYDCKREEIDGPIARILEDRVVDRTLGSPERPTFTTAEQVQASTERVQEGFRGAARNSGGN